MRSLPLFFTKLVATATSLEISKKYLDRSSALHLKCFRSVKRLQILKYFGSKHATFEKKKEIL